MFKNKNPKKVFINVHVKDNPRDYVKKCLVERSSDGKNAYAIIEPATENKAGWKVDITDRVRMCETGSYVEAIRGSNRAVEIRVENQLYKNEPMSNDEYQQLINLKIFKAHYGKLLGDLIAAIKPWLLIVIVVGVIAIAVSGYNAYTLSKMPEQIHALIPVVTPVPTMPPIG